MTSTPSSSQLAVVRSIIASRDRPRACGVDEIAIGRELRRTAFALSGGESANAGAYLAEEFHSFVRGNELSRLIVAIMSDARTATRFLAALRPQARSFEKEGNDVRELFGGPQALEGAIRVALSDCKRDVLAAGAVLGGIGTFLSPDVFEDILSSHFRYPQRGERGSEIGRLGADYNGADRWIASMPHRRALAASVPCLELREQRLKAWMIETRELVTFHKRETLITETVEPDSRHIVVPIHMTFPQKSNRSRTSAACEEESRTAVACNIPVNVALVLQFALQAMGVKRHVPTSELLTEIYDHGNASQIGQNTILRVQPDSALEIRIRLRGFVITSGRIDDGSPTFSALIKATGEGYCKWVRRPTIEVEFRGDWVLDMSRKELQLGIDGAFRELNASAIRCSDVDQLIA